MDSTTRHIDQSEWDQWKDTILSLSSDYSLKEVMAKMNNEHKFNASRSQYETQLDKWGNRKNLKRDEWADILAILDKFKSRSIKSRMSISGQPVSTSKIQRARRYCKGEVGNSKSRTTPEARSARFQKVSIETLGANGEWTPYTNLENVDDDADSLHNRTSGNANDVNNSDQLQNITHGEFPSPNSQAVNGDSFGSTGLDSDERMGNDIGVSGIEDTQLLDNTQVSESQSLNVFGFGEEPFDLSNLPFRPPMLSLSMFDPSMSDPSMTIIQSPIRREPSDFRDIDFWLPYQPENSPTQLSSIGFLDFQNHVHYMPLDLPFKRFELLLEAQGIHLTSGSSNTIGSHVAYANENPISLFLEDIESSMSENRERKVGQQSLHATFLLLSLKNLLPHEDFQGAYNSRQCLITEDEMLQTNLSKILLFSIVNGFAGLQDVPIQSVLKHFSRYGDTGSLLLKFLQASQSHVARALAENLFRAAIEEEDERALKRLLAISAVDVNATTCSINGQKYTPIERAASLLSLGVVELFLSAKADVNKTFDPNDGLGPGVIPLYGPLYGGILGKVVYKLYPGVKIAPVVMELSKVLLQAGARVHLHVLKYALHINHELAYSLFSGVFDSDHSKLISHGFLDQIARQLEDRQATEVIRKILLTCQQTNCGRCLSRFEKKVDWALIQAAKRGHLKLVQLLLGHSKTPQRALSAAIRSGINEVVDNVLTLQPDINAHAHNIDDEEFTYECERRFGGDYCRHNLTTPLAEAIKAKDERLIHMIETAGSLEHLAEGRRFQPAIAAASKTGNILYVRKLLNCWPSPEPSQMYHALLYAVQNEHENIFGALLAAGASVNREHVLERTTPLLAAMQHRNYHMFCEILNADADHPEIEHSHAYRSRTKNSSVCREAVRWGDKSIIQDLQIAFPTIVFFADELSEVLEKRNMVWFEFLLGSGIVSRTALTNGLETALSMGDAELVHYLVERGADPTDKDLLTVCATKYPKMLPLLLEKTGFQSCHRVIPGLGTEALRGAILQGPTGFEAVQILLNSEFVDLNGSGYNFDTLLGLAIEISTEGDHADFAVIKMLLFSGCDPNSVVTTSLYGEPRSNQTALVQAIETKSIALVQLLISHGANVRSEATLGVKRTPLQKAVEVDSLEIVTLLLEVGADTNSKPATRGGATALQLAAIAGNCNIAYKLLMHGADLQAPPAKINGRWPLEGAAEYGRLDMIEFLWKINVADFDKEQFKRAMELAEGNGHMACRDLIAELSQASVPTISH